MGLTDKHLAYGDDIPQTQTEKDYYWKINYQQSCDDCISRQAVLEILKKNRYRFNISQEGYCEGKVLWSKNLIKDDACKEIEQLPSVTPKKKAGTGKWIDDANKIDAQFGRHTYICSECGKYAEHFISGTEVWWDRIKPNFCPNCGAKMVEPQESEDIDENS